MLRVPGITDGGGVRNGFTELVDVMPTLADFAGIPVPSLCPLEPARSRLGCAACLPDACPQNVSVLAGKPGV